MQHANPSAQMHAKQEILSVRKHAHSNSIHRSHDHSPSSENSASVKVRDALYTTMRTKCRQDEHEVEGRITAILYQILQ
jgi:hypothetical protein